MSKYYQPSVRWLQILLAIILLLGITFRFANLGQKPYWYDETYTSLRISGYTTQEVSQNLYQGQILSAADVLQYQKIAPERSLLDTIKGLAQEEPQHPPLYYAIARIWASWFGSSPTSLRCLSACLSLAILPLLYRLCLELFKSPGVGRMAVVICAVSPISIRFAQEARQYSLWSVMILLSSITLLQAIQRRTKLSWGLYALAVMAFSPRRLIGI
jgi:uncharacterized membrane protein